MTQAIDANIVLTAGTQESKTYSVNIKGLMVHLLDILFTVRPEPRTHFASELSGHIQKDIGLDR